MPNDVLLQRSGDGRIANVRLNRPDVRNAFNAAVIASLTAVFEEIASDSSVRAVVLSGEGKVFCGGADISWMRSSLDLTFDQNVGDAQAMSEMFRAIDRCPKPVIGRIHGAALGGGAGLAAVCDIVLASSDAVFGFTEVKLGIIPAVISPFVLAKIGRSHARALFLTGERFDAKRAHHIGLVHEVVVADTLDVCIERVVNEILSAGPNAVAAAKTLIANVSQTSYDASKELTAQAIAKQRTSPEGQEGLRAFLERRSAEWSA
ncbi:MAG TPA: enoyl-CoA hydratase-related protein [Candidatus Baltobacteraceae bacterium]|jgi:methylglutaconyl-CoA hydratase|nr:enoyl-CoA hydratase-related protein [Candidatus Baltobacteraceae bacterium]